MLGGFGITLLSPVIHLLAWPMLIFDRLFPPRCEPEILICMFSGEALIATLLSQLVIYSLIIYAVLKLRLVYLKRVEYIG